MVEFVGMAVVVVIVLTIVLAVLAGIGLVIVIVGGILAALAHIVNAGLPPK